LCNVAWIAFKLTFEKPLYTLASSIAYRCKKDQMSQWHYFRKRLHVLLPENNFFIQMNFWTIVLQIVIIIVYNRPSTWHVSLFIIF
jgi:hypothetical protein